jgi:hypothetical protein
MSEKVIKFAQRVNEVFPEISVDVVLAIWENIDDSCKHIFIKGGKANTQCKTKVKGGGKYCSKHKPKQV